MALRGNLGKLQTFKQQLKALPITVAQEVAKKAAPAMTDLTREAYSGGRTVYGEARPNGVNGQPLSLHKTGATEGSLRFVQVGTIVRCVLGRNYQRYLIGKYGILPNGAMPSDWRKRLDQILGNVKAL